VLLLVHVAASMPITPITQSLARQQVI